MLASLAGDLTLNITCLQWQFADLRTGRGVKDSVAALLHT